MENIWEILPYIFTSIGTGVVLKIIDFYRRFIIKSKVNQTYKILQQVCNPKVFDPKSPPNMDYLKAEARKLANGLKKPLERLRFSTPQPCNSTDDSFKKWFEFIEKVYIELQ